MCIINNINVYNPEKADGNLNFSMVDYIYEL